MDLDKSLLLIGERSQQNRLQKYRVTQTSCWIKNRTINPQTCTGDSPWGPCSPYWEAVSNCCCHSKVGRKEWAPHAQSQQLTNQPSKWNYKSSVVLSLCQAVNCSDWQTGSGSLLLTWLLSGSKAGRQLLLRPRNRELPEHVSNSLSILLFGLWKQFMELKFKALERPQTLLPVEERKEKVYMLH